MAETIPLWNSSVSFLWPILSVKNTNTARPRSAIIRCAEVTGKTTLLLFRVRNVIEAKKGGSQLVAEEMLIWGFSGSAEESNWLSPEQTRKLLHHAVPSSDLSPQARAGFLKNELEEIEELYSSGILDQVALKRAEILVKAHERFQKLLGGGKYKVVEPVLPWISWVCMFCCRKGKVET